VIKGFQKQVLAIVDKIIGFLAEKATQLLKKMGIGGKDKVDEDDPEKAKKVAAGLAAIDTEEAKVLENGKLSHDEAQGVASRVKKNHPVFTSLVVVDGGDSWNYKWKASPGDVKDTPAKKEEATGHAANYEEVKKLVGQPMGTPLPAGYTYREREGRKFPTRTEADDTKFEQLGLDKENKIKLGASEDVDKHPSKFVKPVKEKGNWVLEDKYRGKHMIRTRFYRAGDGYTDDAIKQRDSIIKANTDPANASNWVHPTFTLGVSVPKTDYTVEHSTPVAVHWNTEGNADVQSNRVTWFSFKGRPNEVVVLSRAANSAKGSGGVEFTEVVTLSFRGPGD
jgi:hypothetical protein